MVAKSGLKNRSLFTDLCSIVMTSLLYACSGQTASSQALSDAAILPIFFAEKIAAVVRDSDPRDRAQILEQFNSLPIEVYYQLLYALAPTRDVVINGVPYQNFRDEIGRAKSAIILSAGGAVTVGEYLQKNHIVANFAMHSEDVLTDLSNLHTAVRRLNSGSLGLLKEGGCVTADEVANEPSDTSAAAPPTPSAPSQVSSPEPGIALVRYGDYEISPTSKAHIINRHLPGCSLSTGKTLFGSPAMLNQFFNLLEKKASPVADHLGAHSYSVYSLPNAGSKENYVKIGYRMVNGVRQVQTAFPVEWSPGSPSS